MINETNHIRKFITMFEKIIDLCEKGEDLTEDDKDFLNLYQTHFAIAIMSDLGDENAKKIAKVILGQTGKDTPYYYI